MVRRGELAFNSNGELVAVDSNGNEILLATNEQEIRTELGVPIYSDPTQAPQAEGRIIYVDGNGSASKGLYQHDGSSYSAVGQWQETGSGEITPIDGETIGDGTTTANHQMVDTDEISIGHVVALVEQTGGAQSIPNDTITQLQFDTVRQEDSNVVSVDDANDEITVQKDGVYRINASYHYNNNSNFSVGDRVESLIRVNGNIKKFSREGSNNGADKYKANAERTLRLSQNDTVSFSVRQRSGSSADTVGASHWNNIEVVRLA